MLFIIERGVNDACERLAAAAKNAGHDVRRWSDGDPDPSRGDVFLGSLNAYQTSMPGLIGKPENLNVRAWAPHVREIGLNHTFLTGTVGDIPEVPWPEVFVRPDSPLKPFSGRVVKKENLTPAALDHGFYYDDLDLPIILSPVQPVEAEWRFVVVAGEVVASSGYSADRAEVDNAPPSDAVFLALQAARLNPEPHVVIDVCRLANGVFKLVEYNLLSGADLYGCNADDVVRALASAMNPHG